MATRQTIRLTQLSHGAGCACKIGPSELAPILAALPASTDPRLMVGSQTSDDAAVYRLTDELAIVQSVDFFTPIVDDPYDFGRIAAANALSDIYAMGAEPVLALNLVAFSLERLGGEVLGEILRGGSDIAAEAGIEIAGGHSIDDPEPKYGMAVTGTVHPDRVLTNGGGRSGDELYLTKPLGGGIASTAAKRGIADAGLLARATEVMATLNADASRKAIAAGATAMTDVTGFGLLGHLHEMCAASGVAAELVAEAVPAIDGAFALAATDEAIAGGTRRNMEHSISFTSWAESVPPERRVLLADAMTSGGLLVAVPSSSADSAPGVRIGRLTDGPAGTVRVA